MEIETLNLNRICRTCKFITPQMRSVFEGYETPLQSPRIDEMLMECTSIQVTSGDDLPVQICQICVEKLYNSFIFKRQCEEIDASLREYSKNVNDIQIKQELEDSEFTEPYNTSNDLVTEEFSCKSLKESSVVTLAPKIESDNNLVFTPVEESCDELISTGKMYKCKYCNKSFTNLNRCQKHEPLHWKAYVCRMCNKTLTRMDHLKTHLATHLKEKPYSCGTCNIGFSRIQHLRRHQPRCKGGTMLLCNVCNRAFKREDSLEFHKRMHENEDLKLPIIESLDNIEDLYYPISQDVDHLDLHCMKSKTIVMGGLEGDDVKELGEIALTDEESSTTDNDNINRNLEKSIEDLGGVEDSKEVKVEEYLLAADITLSCHNPPDSINDGMTEKYECPLCNKSFATQMFRDTHVDGHDDQKEYHCKLCEETFLSKSCFIEHMKLHSKHKKFLCSECGQSFTKKMYLVVHMRRHTGEKPFKCKYCEKSFIRSTDVASHEKSHTGEKTHLCTICGKSFGRAYGLTLHMRSHTGEKPYKCDYCDSAFTQSYDFKRHVRRRHSDEQVNKVKLNKKLSN